MSETIEQTGDDLEAILSKTYDDLAAQQDGDDGAQAEQNDQPGDKGDERAGPAAPASWSDAEKAHWETLTPEAREIVLRRERDTEKALHERAEVARRADPIVQAIEPYQDQWAMRGVRPEQAISQLLAAQDALMRNFDAALPELIRAFGRDPHAAAQAMLGQSQAPGQVQAAPIDFRDPRLDAVIAELDEARSRDVAGQIEAFSRDPAHPHFEAVRVEMGKMIQVDPSMSLKDAYDRAVWANPETREKLLAQARITTQPNPPSRRAVSVRDAPTASAGTRNVDRSKMTTNQLLEEAWDNLAR